MNIRNYTSSVPVSTTIARIEAKLACIGALSITKHYDTSPGQVAALVFSIPIDGRNFAVRLPANSEACYQSLLKDYRRNTRRPRLETEEKLKDQARRTAWKLMQDWVDVQASLIVMRQAEPLEVFMPYVWNGSQTLFQSAKSGGYKALPQSTSSQKL